VKKAHERLPSEYFWSEGAICLIMPNKSTVLFIVEPFESLAPDALKEDSTCKDDLRFPIETKAGTFTAPISHHHSLEPRCSNS
jgi:hypothetical protein